MRVFITGGTGFIGKFVVEELARRGHSLLILTRTNKPKNINGRIKTLKGNLGNILKWIHKVKKFRPNVVIHLAWDGIPDFGPERCIQNLTDSLRFYSIIGSLGIRRVITSGTCLEYGDKVTGRATESAHPQQLSLFPATKHAIRSIGTLIAKMAGYEFIWTRPFYVYGPGQRSASLIPSLISAMRKQKRPKLKNPSAQHDFVFVTDVAKALAHLVAVKHLSYDCYNIGSGKLTTIEHISNIIFNSPKQCSPIGGGMYADISRMEEIGWKPLTNIKDGIKQTITADENLRNA